MKNAIIRISVTILAAFATAAAHAGEPKVTTPDLIAFTNTLTQAVGGQWEVNNGLLSGAKQIENGTWEFSCSILPHPATGPAAVKPWEYRLFFCSTPCHVVAVSSNLVLTTVSTNLVAGLKKVVETLALRSVQPAKPIRRFLDEDCGLGVGMNGLKLKKMEPKAPTTPPTVQ
jgi:hypothetical protein